MPNLTMNVDDNELFVRLLNNESEIPDAMRDSHKLLLGAHDQTRKCVRKIVSPADEQDHGDVLNRWLDFIEDDAVVVLLRVPDEPNAYKMFETLNDRGLHTSKADLIKNHLFHVAGERQAEVQNKWSLMRGALEASDEEAITIRFLRHALIVLRGPVREAEVFTRVEEAARSEPTAVEFVTTLESLANVYVATLYPEHEKWSAYPAQARRAVEVLNLFNIRPLRPLVLAVAHKFEPKREAPKALQFLVSLGVRLLFTTGTRSESVERPLAVAAQKVFEESIETATQLRAELVGLTPTDQVFRSSFEIAKVSTAKLGRYYLRSLEMTAKGETEPWFVPQEDASIITLEHVLPQKPEDNWSAFSEEDVRQQVSRLGNLALMKASDNANLKSGSFSDKREVYANSPYETTRMLGEVDEWTPEAIYDRQKLLADLAVSTWPDTT